VLQHDVRSRALGLVALEAELKKAAAIHGDACAPEKKKGEAERWKKKIKVSTRKVEQEQS
jgi:hypothetical protein